MDVTDNPAGLSILIPAFYASAGVTLFAAIQFAVIGWVGHRKPLYLSFSILCLSAVGFITATALAYSASSVAIGAVDLRWQIFCFCLFFPAFFEFVALYTGQRRIRPWLIALTALCLVLALVNFEMPYSLRYISMVMADPLRLPWGETLTRFSGELSPWLTFARIVVLVILGWAIWRTVLQFRAGQRRSARFLAAAILLFLFSLIEGWMVDHGYLDFVYVVAFAYMSIILVMSFGLGSEINVRNMELEATASRTQKGDRKTGDGRKSYPGYGLSRLPDRPGKPRAA